MSGIEDADAGHVEDEVAARLAEADQAAHRAHTAAQSLANLIGSLDYTDDPVGADIRRVVESAMGNQIGDMNSLVKSLDEFQDQIREAQAAQLGVDEDAARGFGALNFTEDAPGPGKHGGGHGKHSGETAAARPVDFEEGVGPLKESPDDPGDKPGVRDVDKGGPSGADGDPSRGRGNDPVGGLGAHKDAKYHIGSPQRPDIPNDDGVEYGSKESNLHDEAEWAKWGALNEGARALRPDLDDATQLYDHYRDNTGTPVKFDYEEAYREDDAVRANVNEKIAEAQRAAERLIREGNTSFSMTGGSTLSPHGTSSEDWQKTIGNYQQWASGDVRVEGNKVTMTVTVHAQDRYNFDPGKADIKSGIPDNANARFAQIGWAKPFDSSGELTRTVTWNLGEAPGSVYADSSEPARNPGREDRVDERNSGDPPATDRPSNNRDTGRAGY